MLLTGLLYSYLNKHLKHPRAAALALLPTVITCTHPGDAPLDRRNAEEVAVAVTEQQQRLAICASPWFSVDDRDGDAEEIRKQLTAANSKFISPCACPYWVPFDTVFVERMEGDPTQLRVFRQGKYYPQGSLLDHLYVLAQEKRRWPEITILEILKRVVEALLYARPDVNSRDYGNLSTNSVFLATDPGTSQVTEAQVRFLITSPESTEANSNQNQNQNQNQTETPRPLDFARDFIQYPSWALASAAPEVKSNDSCYITHSKWAPGLDSFALGSLLFEMITLHKPNFVGRSLEDILNRALPPRLNGYSYGLRALLFSLLHTENPGERPTLYQVLETIHHLQEELVPISMSCSHTPFIPLHHVIQSAAPLPQDPAEVATVFAAVIWSMARDDYRLARWEHYKHNPPAVALACIPGASTFRVDCRRIPDPEFAPAFYLWSLSLRNSPKPPRQDQDAALPNLLDHYLVKYLATKRALQTEAEKSGLSFSDLDVSKVPTLSQMEWKFPQSYGNLTAMMALLSTKAQAQTQAVLAQKEKSLMWPIFKRVAEALHFLHVRGMSHGNVCPDLVVMDVKGPTLVFLPSLPAILAALPGYILGEDLEIHQSRMEKAKAKAKCAPWTSEFLQRDNQKEDLRMLSFTMFVTLARFSKMAFQLKESLQLAKRPRQRRSAKKKMKKLLLADGYSPRLVSLIVDHLLSSKPPSAAEVAATLERWISETQAPTQIATHWPLLKQLLGVAKQTQCLDLSPLLSRQYENVSVVSVVEQLYSATTIPEKDLNWRIQNKAETEATVVTLKAILCLSHAMFYQRLEAWKNWASRDGEGTESKSSKAKAKAKAKATEQTGRATPTCIWSLLLSADGNVLDRGPLDQITLCGIRRDAWPLLLVLELNLCTQPLAQFLEERALEYGTSGSQSQGQSQSQSLSCPCPSLQEYLALRVVPFPSVMRWHKLKAAHGSLTLSGSVFGSPQTRTLCYPNAPEILGKPCNDDPETFRRKCADDIWGMGLLLYRCFTSKLGPQTRVVSSSEAVPSSSPSTRVLRKRFASTAIRECKKLGASPMFLNLLRRLLSTHEDPRKLLEIWEATQRGAELKVYGPKRCRDEFQFLEPLAPYERLLFRIRIRENKEMQERVIQAVPGTRAHFHWYDEHDQGLRGIILYPREHPPVKTLDLWMNEQETRFTTPVMLRCAAKILGIVAETLQVRSETIKDWPGVHLSVDNILVDENCEKFYLTTAYPAWTVGSYESWRPVSRYPQVSNDNRSELVQHLITFRQVASEMTDQVEWKETHVHPARNYLFEFQELIFEEFSRALDDRKWRTKALGEAENVLQRAQAKLLELSEIA